MCTQAYKHERVTKTLNLPAALDALEKPISLPPSLLAKAREIRGHDTPSLIERSLDVIEGLSSQNSTTLDEVIWLTLNLKRHVSLSRRQLELSTRKRKRMRISAKTTS